MTNASQSFVETNTPRYISKTDAVYNNRTTYTVIARLIREGKIAVHLVDGKIMIDGDEAAREIANFKNRRLVTPAVRSLF
jgi:hypothetical protein